MTAKHTPGAWAVVDRGDELAVVADDGFPGYATVATIALDEQPEYITNAHLIAAAPDLLAACKSVVAFFDAINREQHERTMPPVTFAEAAKNWQLPSEVESLAMAPILAAIAKAEGK